MSGTAPSSSHMSAADSTEPGGKGEVGREVISAAAGGILPDWAVASRERRAHAGRVAELLGDWAESLGLGEDERIRWRAAGWLHDALRDADPESLRESLPAEYRGLPGPILHGPAAALRLRDDGVDDVELLAAITWHTIGHPDLGALGRALYIADAIEPGRTWDPGWTALQRARMPAAFDAVLIEVAAERIGHQLARRRPLRPEAIDLWNSLAG